MMVYRLQLSLGLVVLATAVTMRGMDNRLIHCCLLPSVSLRTRDQFDVTIYPVIHTHSCNPDPGTTVDSHGDRPFVIAFVSQPSFSHSRVPQAQMPNTVLYSCNCILLCDQSFWYSRAVYQYQSGPVRVQRQALVAFIDLDPIILNQVDD